MGLDMLDRKDLPGSNLWTPPICLPAKAEWWGWPVLDLLADVPEIVLRYLFIKGRNQILSLRSRFARRSDDQRRDRQGD
jgi:hypothetical protein